MSEDTVDIIHLGPSLSLPNTPANRGFLELTKKLQDADRKKRYREWLLNTTGLPLIEGNRARSAYVVGAYLRSRFAPPSSSP
jgi:hypothetical protein